MPVTRLQKLLQSGPGNSLGEVIARAQHMQKLTVVLQAALARDLADNLLGASLRDDGELVLICSTSAWASRLRFESEHLIAVAKKHGIEAKSCRVAVSQQL
jgi:hypothetical protein